MKNRSISLFALGLMFAATKSFLISSFPACRIPACLQRGPLSLQPASRLLNSKKHQQQQQFNEDAVRSSDSSNDYDPNMSKIEEVNVIFETVSNEKHVTIQKGEILRSAMLKNGISPHNGRSRLINCRGLGTCGTCAVEVTSPSDSNDAPIEPRERNTKERLRLNFPPHGSSDQSSNLRLACQIQVNDCVTVKKRTGFWGQDTAGLAEEFESELWFGELEFILDDKSPSRKAE